MINFNIHNTYTHFVPDTHNEWEKVKEALTYEIKNTYGLKKSLEKKYKNKAKIFQELDKLKYKHFIINKNYFPTGHLNRVIKNLKKNNIKYNINDMRQFDQIQIPQKIELKTVTPYPYQANLIKEIIEKQRIIFSVGTGGGKTKAAILVSKYLKKKTLFITHKLDLLYQTYKDFKTETDLKIGIVGDGKFQEGDVIIGTTGTLYNLIKKDKEFAFKYFSEFNLLIIDEAHRTSSKSFETIANFCVNAVYRLGLTATPFMKSEEENMRLEGCISDNIIEVTPEELINLNILAQPYFYYIPINNQEIYGSEWHEIYSNGIVNNEIRNTLIATKAIERINRGDRVLIIVLQIEHGQKIYDLIKDVCNIKYVNGSDDTQYRQQVMEELENKTIDGIIATNIFDEGIDIRSLNCVILGAGTESAPALFQRVGRGIRKKEKNKALIIDFIDYQNKILLKHSIQRYKYIKEKPGYKILKDINEYDKI